ncbi:MAG: 50S ribosomal protein L11 [Candidatus Absconditabacterales bacterium]|nr:50S ribosomal protein L11 [Candidatus Absconditabacterales bacterium]
MAAKLQKILYLEVVAGKAQPAPPLGPMLGANGVNIGMFIKDFNAMTMPIMQEFAGADIKVKVKLSIFVDRTFTIEIGGKVTSTLILWKLNQKLGSGEPNKKKIGKLTKDDIRTIAQLKAGDMNTDNIESMMKSVMGTCRNMGVDIV